MSTSNPFTGNPDILALGWVHEGAFFYKWPADTSIDEISNRPLSWRLNFVDYDRYVKIECYERNTFEWETAYMGPAPDVFKLKVVMNWFDLKLSQLYPVPELSAIEVGFPTYGIAEQMIALHSKYYNAHPDTWPPLYTQWANLFRAYNRATGQNKGLGCRPCYMAVYHWYKKELKQIEDNAKGNI